MNAIHTPEIEDLIQGANEGDPEAQYDLGWRYSAGRDVQQNDEEAMKWLRKAAEQGRTKSQNILGMMYSIGHSVPQDYVEAHIWWNLAAAQGDEKAREKRDIVARMLTASQLADAQCRARKKKEEIHDE